MRLALPLQVNLFVLHGNIALKRMFLKTIIIICVIKLSLTTTVPRDVRNTVGGADDDLTDLTDCCLMFVDACGNQVVSYLCQQTCASRQQYKELPRISISTAGFGELDIEMTKDDETPVLVKAASSDLRCYFRTKLFPEEVEVGLNWFFIWGKCRLCKCVLKNGKAGFVCKDVAGCIKDDFEQKYEEVSSHE